MTHDSGRHATATLFALGVLDGRVIGASGSATGTSNFIRSFDAVERKVPTAMLIDMVLDNYTAHKHPKVLAPIGSRAAYRRALATRNHTRSRVGIYPPMTAISRPTSQSRSIGIICWPRWAAESCATTRVSEPMLAA